MGPAIRPTNGTRSGQRWRMGVFIWSRSVLGRVPKWVCRATINRRAFLGNHKTAYSRYMYYWVRRNRHYRASTLGIAPSK
jgi:hypothetical protein